MKKQIRIQVLTMLLVFTTCISTSAQMNIDTLAKREAMYLATTLKLSPVQIKQIRQEVRSYKSSLDSIQAFHSDTSIKHLVMAQRTTDFSVRLQQILTTEQYRKYLLLLAQTRTKFVQRQKSAATQVQ